MKFSYLLQLYRMCDSINQNAISADICEFMNQQFESGDRGLRVQRVLTMSGTE